MLLSTVVRSFLPCVFRDSSIFLLSVHVRADSVFSVHLDLHTTRSFAAAGRLPIPFQLKMQSITKSKHTICVLQEEELAYLSLDGTNYSEVYFFILQETVIPLAGGTFYDFFCAPFSCSFFLLSFLFPLPSVLFGLSQAPPPRSKSPARLEYRQGFFLFSLSDASLTQAQALGSSFQIAEGFFFFLTVSRSLLDLLSRH